MNTDLERGGSSRTRLGLFVLLQTVVMLLAVSGESLWIDEFWTAHLSALPSFSSFFQLLIVPSGSQTPLHFLHFYLWEQLNLNGEYLFRLANLPLFVAGQVAVYLALRDGPRTFSWLFLLLSAMHPLVWQYANEARPYIMMFAGAQMMLAYLLRMHRCGIDGRPVEPGFLAFFVLGGILLFGASLLGAFWVLAASVYALVYHWRVSRLAELLRGVNLLLVLILLAATLCLGLYYLSSLLKGAGASRLATSTPATLLFAVYELLGLGGIGPGRLDLRSQGVAALRPYTLALLVATPVLLAVLFAGLREACRRLGGLTFIGLLGLGLLPVVIVVSSGLVMHWRVLGRHLIASLPLLNLLWALGLVALLQSLPKNRPGLGALLILTCSVACLGALTVSSLNLRWHPRHDKDDYRNAAVLAMTAVQQHKRVWWAADVIGARYYGLPGEFDVIGELTGVHQPPVCNDRPGVQPVANFSPACLLGLSTPELVILSKPETFDTQGAVFAYLKAARFKVVKELPAFTVWAPTGALPSASRP